MPWLLAALWVVAGISGHFKLYRQNFDVTTGSLPLILLLGACYGPMWWLFILVSASDKGRVVFRRRP